MNRQPSRPRWPARVEPVHRYLAPDPPAFGVVSRARWPTMMTPSQVAHRLRLEDDDASPAQHDKPDRP